MFKVALCQAGGSRLTHVENYKEDCMNKIEAMVTEAADNEADIVCLPEMWNCPYSNRAFEDFKEPEQGETWKFMRRLAAENHIYLIGGSIPEAEGDKIYNTCFVFNPIGSQIAKHRKAHLFDIDVEGGQKFRESDTLTAGDSVTVFDTMVGRIGVIICFDIRFADFVRKTAIDEGAQMIFMPASFNMTTGPAHWDMTIKSRALDNQIFFAACAPARDESASYVSYANSAIAGPWGDFKAHAGEGEEILYADIDFDEITKVRSMLPIVKARRTELY